MSTIRSSARVDKWLWHARIVKSRSLASQLVRAGKVRINRTRISSAAKPVRAGDTLTISLRGNVRVLHVLALGVRRGPAREAQRLYEERSPVRRSQDGAREIRRDAGTRRPTKKERRQIMALMRNRT